MPSIGRYNMHEWMELDDLQRSDAIYRVQREMMAQQMQKSEQRRHEEYFYGEGYRQKPNPEPEPTPIEETRHGMNYSKAVFLINNNVRAIRGTYEDKGTTAVFKTFDQTLKVGELVVVPTTTRHGFTAFKISEVDVDIDMDSSEKMDWVVQRVDLVGYEATLSQEADAVAKIKSAELRKKRSDLAENLLKDSLAEMKALPISTMGDPAPLPPA